jgi:uncharacterized ferritin-like protein (DUF455 family)
MTDGTIPTKVIRGVTLRQPPAREDCFRLVDSESAMESRPDMSLVSRRERLHRHMHGETVVLESAAQSLVDFPDAPWELRMLLAMQAADEARHAGLMYRRFKELGGTKGEFPVGAFEWAVAGMLRNIAGRIAIINRTFEAGLIDLLGNLRNVWRDVGDHETADLLDGVLADEIVHVRFGNRWIKRMTEQNPRVLIQVAAAVRLLSQALAAVDPEDGGVNQSGTELTPGQKPAVNVEARLEAEFTEDEVKAVLRQAGFQSILPHRLVEEAKA